MIYVSKFEMGRNDDIILSSEASEAQQPWRKCTKFGTFRRVEWKHHLRIEDVVTLLQFCPFVWV